MNGFTGTEAWETRFLLWMFYRAWHIAARVDYEGHTVTVCGMEPEVCYRLGFNTHFYLHNTMGEPICQKCRAALMKAGKSGAIGEGP